jgi:hypothetical protein
VTEKTRFFALPRFPENISLIRICAKPSRLPDPTRNRKRLFIQGFFKKAGLVQPLLCTSVLLPAVRGEAGDVDGVGYLTPYLPYFGSKNNFPAAFLRQKLMEETNGNHIS